jgi:MinD-like ATPase involved in chromosome partitioning or flagellar assembly
MAEPEIALVFSAEPWVELLHRHCSDHGGARVRQLLVDPVLALDEEYSTLVTGHRWPALTPALVDELHRHGRSVLGVWDRAEPESRALLTAVGVDGLVANDASAPEFVAAIGALPGPSDPRPAVLDDPIAARGGRRVVIGGPAGAGSTEIAIALARALNEQRVRPVLVDVDEVAPAIAPRLGLPLEPNLSTAVDAVEFHAGSLTDAITDLDDFAVVTGIPAPPGWTRLRPPEVLRVVRSLARDYRFVILDVAAPARREAALGNRAQQDLARAVISDADVLIGVAAPTPVGIARFVAWLADVLPHAIEAELHVVVNRASAHAFRRGEIHSEIFQCVRPESLTFVPADRRVEAAAWSGGLVPRGGFARAVGEVAAKLIQPATAPAQTTTSGGRP